MGLSFLLHKVVVKVPLVETSCKNGAKTMPKAKVQEQLRGCEF